VVKVRVMPDVKARWRDAAARAGVDLSAWLTEAAELAIARGSTR
jgi:predicted HicB family RNase H-like nuclease